MRKGLILILGLMVASVYADNCIKCHSDISPKMVKDYKISAHYEEDVSCSDCHGDEHQTDTDFENAGIPTPETCAGCHEKQVNQYKKGKHSFAWAALKAMPTTHFKPMELIDGGKGCGG